jgi:hypothetical protein
MLLACNFQASFILLQVEQLKISFDAQKQKFPLLIRQLKLRKDGKHTGWNKRIFELDPGFSSDMDAKRHMVTPRGNFNVCSAGQTGIKHAISRMLFVLPDAPPPKKGEPGQLKK